MHYPIIGNNSKVHFANIIIFFSFCHQIISIVHEHFVVLGGNFRLKHLCEIFPGTIGLHLLMAVKLALQIL